MDQALGVARSVPKFHRSRSMYARCLERSGKNVILRIPGGCEGSDGGHELLWLGHSVRRVRARVAGGARHRRVDGQVGIRRDKSPEAR